MSQVDSTPFDNFRNLLRKVISVPKSEIDARESEYQKEQAKKKSLKKTPKQQPG